MLSILVAAKDKVEEEAVSLNERREGRISWNVIFYWRKRKTNKRKLHTPTSCMTLTQTKHKRVHCTCETRVQSFIMAYLRCVPLVLALSSQHLALCSKRTTRHCYTPTSAARLHFSVIQGSHSIPYCSPVHAVCTCLPRTSSRTL